MPGLLAIAPGPGRLGQPALAQTVQLINQQGWLQVSRLQGNVTLIQRSQRPARVGDRLRDPGDQIVTGPAAATTLEVDNRIGTIQVAENSSLRVRQLGVARNGGWVTTLNLERGQARIKVNKQVLPQNSIFEVHSPSGVAGVRGTDFGLMLNAENRMVVGTETGLVEASSQGETLAIQPDFGTALFVSQPPLPPLPLDRKLELDLVEVDYREGRLWLSGSIYPLNTIIANGVELSVDRNGGFGQAIAMPQDDRLSIRVANSLGQKQGYLLVGLNREVE